MTSKQEKFLKARDFEKALARLDLEMGKDDFLAAFAPINVVSAGGFLAVTYFKNREATGDLDYMIDPEWANDNEITSPLEAAIQTVAKKEEIEVDWMNDGLKIWASGEAYRTIFKEAYKQNILLFDGQSIKVWAAPFEWALERKIRRIAFSDRGSKDVDMDDALALFRHFRKSNNRPLDMEYFRNLNMNGFDLVPGVDQMEKIAANYRSLYKQDLFSSPAQVVSQSSYATTASINGWGECLWSDQYECYYRSRPNAAEPDGYEYEYDMTAAATSISKS